MHQHLVVVNAAPALAALSALKCQPPVLVLTLSSVLLNVHFTVPLGPSALLLALIHCSAAITMLVLLVVQPLWPLLTAHTLVCSSMPPQLVARNVNHSATLLSLPVPALMLSGPPRQLV